MHHFSRRMLFLGALFFLVGCGGTLHGATFNDIEPAPDITLTRTDGTPFRLSEQRDRVVLLFYGFTSCPDICPTTMSDLARAYEQLDATEAERVLVAMVTVDPDRDTPERLEQYVTRFNPAFIGLSGTPSELAAAMAPYGVYAQRRDLPTSALGYTMDHSPYVYVIDRSGNWREFFTLEHTPDQIASDMAVLAREKP